MLTTHVHDIDTSNNGVISIEHHPLAENNLSVNTGLNVTTGEIAVKLAMLVDDSKPKVTSQFFLNHTGKPIDEPIVSKYKLQLVGYVNFIGPKAKPVGCALYKLVSMNVKKYQVTLKLDSPAVSSTTLSLLMNQILRTKMAIEGAYIDEHISNGVIDNTGNVSIMTTMMSEDFFSRYYGQFASHVTSLPTFRSVDFALVG